MHRAGPKCLIYNLEYASLFDNWEDRRMDMMSLTRKIIPDEMMSLSRTVKNFAPIVLLAMEVNSKLTVAC